MNWSIGASRYLIRISKWLDEIRSNWDRLASSDAIPQPVCFQCGNTPELGVNQLFVSRGHSVA